jgi:hypothetical protein
MLAAIFAEMLSWGVSLRHDPTLSNWQLAKNEITQG